jgi:hypothetical protein
MASSWIIEQLTNAAGSYVPLSVDPLEHRSDVKCKWVVGGIRLPFMERSCKVRIQLASRRTAKYAYAMQSSVAVNVGRE